MADDASWLKRITDRFRGSGRARGEASREADPTTVSPSKKVDWEAVERRTAWRERNPVLPSIDREQTPLDAEALRERLLEALDDQLRSDNPDYYALDGFEPVTQVDRTLLLAEAYGLYNGAVVATSDWDGRDVSVPVEQFEPNLFGGPEVVLPNSDGTFFHVGMGEVRHAPTEAALQAQLSPAAVAEFKELRSSVDQLAVPQDGSVETWLERGKAGALYTRLTGTPTDLSGRPEAEHATTDPVSESAHDERSLSPAAREALEASATGERSSGALRPTNGAQPAKVWGSVPLRDLGDGRGM